jgi:hypothetical protein
MNERTRGGSSGVCTPTIDGLPVPCSHLWKDGEWMQKCVICWAERIN